MFQFSVREVTAHQLLDRGLSWEDIREYCNQHSTMLSNWDPQSIQEIEQAARTYRYCVRMREWYSTNSTL
jgi:hypothetical protein